MKIDELMSKPVWQMTGEELMFLQNHNARPDDALPQSIIDNYYCFLHHVMQFNPPPAATERVTSS